MFLLHLEFMIRANNTNTYKVKSTDCGGIRINCFTTINYQPVDGFYPLNWNVTILWHRLISWLGLYSVVCFMSFRTLLHLALFIVSHNILVDGMLEARKRVELNKMLTRLRSVEVALTINTIRSGDKNGLIRCRTCSYSGEILGDNCWELILVKVEKSTHIPSRKV